MTEELVKTKEVLYRGKNVEELKKLGVREVVKYLPSRARRAVLRNFDKIEKFIKKCEECKKNNKKIRTHLREIVIVPKMIGYNVAVYNGKNYVEFEITSQMIGHRLGEFSHTTGKVAHNVAGIGATKSSRALKK